MISDPIQQLAGATPTPGAPARSGRSGSSFAAVMANAQATAESPAGGASDAQARLDALRERLRVPRGERWEPVPGRSDYADIVAGPRNGFYVNLQPGPRQGEAFHVVRKDGRELHVYGEGRDREIVEVRRRTPAPDPERVRPREGETFEEVGNHTRYRRIEGGDRDDLYINLSGNERTGRTFRIVEREGQRFHVYGSGRDRLEIPVGGRGRGRDDEAAPADGTTGGATGGATPTGSPSA